jgi:hypothetical protein
VEAISSTLSTLPILAPDLFGEFASRKNRIQNFTRCALILEPPNKKTAFGRSSGLSTFSEFERAETEFIPGVGGRRHDERKRRIWVLLPHSEIFSRNRQPAESKHISARFGYPSDLCPGDLIDGQLFPAFIP